VGIARAALAPCLIWCVLGTVSCSSSPSAPGADSLAVRSAVPTQGSVLTAGTQVTFTYRITFTLTSESALVGMVFIPNQSIAGASDTRARSTIRRGTTTLTLSDSFAIPAGTHNLDVFIAMENQDRIGQTSTVITYPVQ
jgi:hypothetical protein